MMNLLSGNLNEQVAFYERYLAEASVSAKLMKADIKNRLKPVKEPKAKKEPKEKKPKKTEQLSNANNDIITQIVQRANSLDGSSFIVECHVPTEEPKVEELKVEEPKVEEPKVEEPKVEEPTVEKKKRVRKEKDGVEKKDVVEKKKRTKKVVEQVVTTEVVDQVVTTEVVEQVVTTEVVDQDEITLNAVLIDEVEYFYDSKNQLYNADHIVIGTFNPVTLSASFV
jgi:hypothetical protein